LRPSDGKWLVNLVARQLATGCHSGVYWGRIALPSSGELAGRASLQASDQLWATNELSLAYPSVAVAGSGVVWVGYVLSGSSTPAGAGRWAWHGGLPVIPGRLVG
jgi:hypothetical protein